MKPIELLAWRRENKFTQARLGVALGVSRRTIHSWENGTYNMPDDMPIQLAKLTTQAPGDAALAEPPPIVCPNTTERRYRQYALYIKHRADGYSTGPEHPRNLFPSKWRQDERIPLAFLETDEYRQAVAQHRSQKSELPSRFRD
jgi:DNA-binding XRE family transcriptional regulator